MIIWLQTVTEHSSSSILLIREKNVRKHKNAELHCAPPPPPAHLAHSLPYAAPCVHTYVVSQLEVFLARQLIVHSFDQLQDLQREGGARRKRGKKETSCRMLSDCCRSHKERRPAAPSASSRRWGGERLSELGTRTLDKTSAALEDDRWGLLWPGRRASRSRVWLRLLPSAGQMWRCEPANRADC